MKPAPTAPTTSAASTSDFDLNMVLKHTLALVLAGGRGTRLMQLTDRESKPAVPFGGKFRIIDFPLSNCVNSGLRRISVLTQYRAHTLIHHVQKAWNFLRPEIGEFVELWPAQQQTESANWYQGTADAVYQNLEFIRGHAPSYILILAGDHIYKQDYSRMLREHVESGADATVACVEVPLDRASSFGIVGTDVNDRIINFVEKPKNPPALPDKPDRAFASMGIYIFNADLLIDLLEEDAYDTNSSHDFGKDLLPTLVKRQAKLMCHRFSRSCVFSEGTSIEPYWRDVGTVDAYWEANMDLTSVTPDLDLYNPEWPIWTYQRQRPPAKFVFDDDDRRGHALDSLLSAGCIVSGGTVRGSLCFTDVRVNSYCLVEQSVILPDTDIGRHCRITKAIIAQNCRVPEGLVIGEDPEEDARRFHRTEGGICLVTAEALAKIAQEG